MQRRILSPSFNHCLKGLSPRRTKLEIYFLKPLSKHQLVLRMKSSSYYRDDPTTVTRRMPMSMPMPDPHPVPLENINPTKKGTLTSSKHNKSKLLLLQSAQEFLFERQKECLSKPNLPPDLKNIIQTQFQIRQIILKLAVQFWNRNESSHTNHLSKPTSSTKSSSTQEEEQQLVQAVHTANKLAHLLLDSKQHMIHCSDADSSFANTRYPPSYTQNTKHHHFVFLNNVLHGWMRISHVHESYAQCAHQLLLRMIDLHSKNPYDPDLHMDTISFSLCIQAFANSKDVVTCQPALQALQLLVQLEQLYHSSKKTTTTTTTQDKKDNSSMSVYSKIIPNSKVYNNCLHGFAKRGMMDEAELLLNIMERNYFHHFKTSTTTTLTSSTVSLPSSSSSSSSSDTAFVNPVLQDQTYQTLFLYLQQLQESSMIFPDTVSYTTCIDACSKAKRKVINNSSNLPKEIRAERIFTRMLNLYDTTQDIRFRPTHVTYGTVMGLYAKWNHAHAPILAYHCLQTLIQLSERDNKSIKNSSVSKTKMFYSLQPNTFMFTSVMSTFTRQKVIDAEEKVSFLLGQMERLYEGGNELCKPTYQCFVICLDAYAKSKKEDSAEKAENILPRLEELYLNQKMKDLNRIAYNSVIEAWGRKYNNKEAVHRAQGILLRMKTMYDQTKNPAFLPDKYSYTGIMTAWLYRNDGLAHEKCMRLLEEMKEEYHRGNHLLKPDSFVYAQVINAFAHARRPLEALSLLSEMENSINHTLWGSAPIPTIYCYNGVMKAFAKSDLPDRAKHAWKLLQDMKSKVDIFKIRPNLITYSTCIYAFARSNEIDRVEKAESILQELIHAYQETKSNDYKPSKDTWSHLILTYAYSESKDRVEKALSVISRIVDFGMNPVNSHFNIILLACSLDAKLFESQSAELEHTIPRKTLCRIVYKVMATFDQVAYGIRPDSITFMNLINCTSLFLDLDERNAFIKTTVDRCKEEGLVDEGFIDLLRKRAPTPLFLELFPGNDGTKKFVIPLQWSKSVRSSNYVRREERKSPKYDDETFTSAIDDSHGWGILNSVAQK